VATTVIRAMSQLGDTSLVNGVNDGEAESQNQHIRSEKCSIFVTNIE
jgi:hypothetical protein